MVKNRKSDATSKKQYKGVRMRSWGSWVSEIRAPNQKTRIWLGSYSTAEAAARAYDAALLCLKGPKSEFNFPESAHIRVPPPDAPLSAKSIQSLAAAAAAANAPSPTPPASPSIDASELSTAVEDSSVDSSTWLESSDGGVLFQSPKCMDELMMLGGGGCSFFDPQLVAEDFSDDAEAFNLWNFF